MGKKSKKKIIAFLMSAILLFSPIILFAGTIAVASESVTSLVDKVCDFFTDLWDTVVDFFIGDSDDFKYMSLDDLIEAVEKDDSFSDEQLDGMHIDRDTFLYLLKKVSDYNNRPNYINVDVELLAKVADLSIVSEEHWEQVRSIPGLIATPSKLESFLYTYYGESLYKSFSTYVKCSLIDKTVEDAQLDWQFLYLFSQYYGLTHIFDGDNDDWYVSRDIVDKVFEFVKPSVRYKSPISLEGENVKLSQADVLASYPRDNCNYYIVEAVNELGVTCTYSGYAPILVAESLETMLSEVCWNNYYEWGSMKEVWTWNPKSYMKKFYYCVDSLTRGFIWEIFIDHLSSLPGSAFLVDEVEKYQLLYEQDLENKKSSY